MKNKILVSITGKTEKEWQDKLQEIENHNITEVSLFLEMYERPDRDKICQALLQSNIKSIPLVHIRHDMEKEELVFLQKNFNTKYFTIHERSFVDNDIVKWKGFYQDIYLEMDTNGIVSNKVKVEKIGGFCIDLAHFKVDMEKLNKDFDYVYEKKDQNLFKCNHISGWDPVKNVDMHTINQLSDFDYLKTLPDFPLGSVLALEMFNSIAEQLEFKTYLTELLTKKFEANPLVIK